MMTTDLLTRLIATAGVIVGASLAGCTGRDETSAPPQVTALTEPSLPDFNQSQGWLGGDGATTVDLGDGRVLWLFGDTFVGSLKPDGGCADGTKMVNNTVALQRVDGGGMSFHWGPVKEEAPTSWVLSPVAGEKKAADHWMWPSGGGIRVGEGDNERVVLFFAMMRRRDPPTKSDSIWNFQSHGTATVTILNPRDPPERWRTEAVPLCDHEQALDAGALVRTIGWGPVVMADPTAAGRVLIFGVDSSVVLDKRLVLARAPRESITRFDRWEFRTADGWAGGEENAAPLAKGASDGFSVSRLRIHGRERYMLTQMEANLGKRIMVRFADRLEGPWSDGVPVFTCPEPARDARQFVYLAAAHPEISSADEMIVTYCVNSSDFWDVVRHVATYRPRVVHLPIAELMKACAGTTPSGSER